MEIVEGVFKKVTTVNTENGNVLIRLTQRQLTHISGKRSVFSSNTLRIIHILDGNAKWRVGNKIYDVKKDSLLIFNSNTMRLIMEIPSRVIKYDIIEFSPTVFAGNLSCLDLFFSDESRENVIDLSGENGREIIKGYEEIKNEILSPGLLNKDYIKGKLIVLLVNINRYYDSIGMAIKQEQSDVIRNVTTYIWDNISKEISFDELCSISHMSRSRFSAVFKQYFGVSVVTYIRQCRVLNVIQLIRWKDMNILEAAFQSGFTSSSGFYKTFNSVMGMSPREYLKNQG